MSVSYDAFIGYVKDKSGKDFSTDEEAYQFGQAWLPHITVENVPQTATRQVYDKDQRDINKSPSFFDYLDYGIDEGSADWKKSAYVNSLTGLMEDWTSGDPSRRLNFDAAEYEKNKTLMHDIGSSLLGFVMPLDLATFYGGGKVGGLAVKQLSKRGALKFAEKPLAELGKDALTKEMQNRAMAQALGGGITLGSYSGAMGFVGAKAQGKSTSEAMQSMVEGVLHGGGLGAISGGIAGGMGAKYAALAGKKSLTSYEKWISAITGKPAQFVAEAGVFTVAGTAEEMAINGTEKSFGDIFLHQAIHNAGFIGGMKIGHAMLGRGGRAYDDFADIYFKNREKKLKDSLDPIDEIIKDKESQITSENKELVEASLKPLREERAKLIAHEEAIVKEINDAIGLNKEVITNNFEGSQGEKIVVAENRVNQAKKTIQRLTNESAFNEEVINEVLSKYDTLDSNAKETLVKQGLDSKAKINAKIKELEGHVKVNEKYLEHLNKDFKYEDTEANRVYYESLAKDLGIEFKPGEKKLEVLGAEIKAKKEAARIEGLGKGGAGFEKLSEEVSKIGSQVESLQKPDPIKAFAEQNLDTNVKIEINGKELKTGKKPVKKGEKGTYKSANELINESNLTDNTKQRIYLGVKEFFPRSRGKFSDLKRLVKFAEWLNEKGIRFGENSGKDYSDYLKETKQWKDRNVITGSLVKFFGGTHGKAWGKIISKKGYSGKYMDRDADVLDITWAEVKLGKATRITPQDKKIISKEFDKIITEDISAKEINHKLPDKLVEPNTVKALIEGLYKIPRRINEMLQLKVKDINVNTGEVKFAGSKESDPVTLNIKNLDKGTWNAIVKLLKGKKGSDFIFQFKEKGVLNQATVNALLSHMISKSGVKPISIRGGKKFTSHHFRHSAATDAETILRTTGKDYVDLVQQVLLGHKKDKLTRTHYTPDKYSKSQIETLLKDFYKEREKIKESLEVDAESASKRLGINKDVEVTTKVEEFTKQELIDKGETKFQKEGETKLPVLNVRGKAFKKITTWIQETHPDLILRVEANLGKKDGQAVLGKITNHVIKIAEGKARLDTIPHEVGHHVVDVLEAIGGRQSKKIIRQGIELFGTKEKLVDALGKRVADRILTSRKGASWAKKVWSHIRSFLGMSSKKDVLRILGEEVYTARRMARVKEMYPNLNLKTLVKSDPQFQTESIKTDIKGIEKTKELNEQYGLDSKEVTKILKDGWGVENLSELSKGDLKRYRGFLADSKLKKSEIQNTQDDIISLANYDNISQEAKAWKRAILPVHFVLEKFGGKAGNKIAEKMLEHTYRESQIYGAFDVMLNNIETLIPRKDMDKMYLAIDNTRYKERSKEGYLTQADEAFVKKAKTKGTKEYEAVQEHKKMTNMAWKMLDATAKRHRNDAEYENFKKKFGDKYVKDYYTRRLTRKAIEVLEPNAKFMDRVVNDNIRGILEYKSKNKPKGWLDKMIDMKRGKIEKSQEYKNIEEKARIDLYEAITFAPSQVKNPYLLKRMPKLPEKIQDPKTGKYIETYETKFSNSTERYVGTMSKFLATADIFPEYTYVGGKHTRGRAKTDILKLAETKDTMANYAALSLSRQLGLSFDIRDALNRSGTRALGQVAHASAVMGLSSPLSGFKNLILGIVHNFSTYGAKNTLKAMSKMFSEEAQRDARLAGAIEFGGKHREFSGTGMRLFFKMNLMGKTEMWNRIASRIAGDLALQETVSRIRGESMFLRNYKKGVAEDKLKGIWKLSDNDINFLKTSKLQSQGELARYNEILQRGKHFSHIAAQGGTGTPFLPLWMSGKGNKPFTLFQRMAYSVSYHTWRNYYQPFVKHGNIAPMATHLIASYMGGAALYGVITNLLGVEPPKSQSKDSLETAAMYLWKAEYLGMANELISPYMAEDGVRNPIMTPVILRHLKDGSVALAKFFSGVLNEKQLLETLMTNTTPVASQILRIKDLATKPLYKGMKRGGALRTQYWNAKGKTPSKIESWSRRQPYYKDLTNAFIGGDEKQMALSYWSAYNYLVSNMVYKDTYTFPAADKEAKSILKGKITRMNPINLSEDVKGKTISRRNEFLAFLDPKTKAEMLKYEKQYYFRARNFWKILPKYAKKYSMTVK